MILRQALYNRQSNRRYPTFPQVAERRIAWVALGYRLPIPDMETFSREMKTSAVSSALDKRYYRPHAHAGKLQVCEEESGSLQIRRLKSFCEPGIQVA